MAKHSPVREGMPLLEGLPLLHRGKVRDTYGLQDGNILIVATDSISIFDFELNAQVPMKGIILNALSVYWCRLLETHGIKTHLIADGSRIDQYLPEHLRNNCDLQARAIVAKKFDMAPIEFIIRGCLTGSGLKAYNKTGEICGIKLPEGLGDGDKLPFPLDTPTTKALSGHDVHLDAEDIRMRYPEQTDLALKVFKLAQKFADDRGLVFADTKFEFSMDGTLCDEVLTPDSSRIWDKMDWLMTRKAKKAPQSNDKEIVRAWGKTLGIDKLDPEDPDDVAYVHSLEVPGDIIWNTAAAYRYVFWRLAGITIERFLRNFLYVDYPVRGKKIIIVCGSESDLGVVKAALNGGSNCPAEISVHVMSCHRNPREVMEFAEKLPDGIDIIIGVGGKAFALPGILDSWVRHFGKKVRIGGVALGDPNSESFLAAKLSITEIPEKPVVLEEFTGEAYVGSQGLRELISRVCDGEIPPLKARTDKPAKMDIVL